MDRKIRKLYIYTVNNKINSNIVKIYRKFFMADNLTIQQSWIDGRYTTACYGDNKLKRYLTCQPQYV